MTTIPTITKDELITEWVAALRSGDYKQGKNYLHDEETDTFCCLGVACDILAKKGILQATTLETTFTHKNFDTGKFVQTPRVVTNYRGPGDSDSSYGLLPESVSRILGLVYMEDYEGEGEAFVEDPSFSVMINGHLSNQNVSALNDNWDYTFEQIADLIETQGFNL